MMRINEIKINYSGNKKGERCTVTISEVTRNELKELKKIARYF